MLRSRELPTASGPARACQNCSRAKAKCEPHLGENTNLCARCFRLKKECLALPRKVRKKRAPNAHTNIAKLEQKIEGLVTLLTSTQGSTTTPVQQEGEEPQNPQNASSDSTLPQRSCPWPVESSSQSAEAPWDAHVAVGMITRAVLANLPTPGDSPSQALGEESRLIAVRCTDPRYLIKVFTQQFAPQFPFVTMPNDMSSEEFELKRPWLYQTIVMIASQYQRARQLGKAKELLMDIAAAMLISGERSIDMAQSLLLFNAWFFYYCSMSHSQQSTGVFQLLVGLLFDLGLTKPPPQAMDDPAAVLNAQQTVGCKEPMKKRTLEERRLFLTCFFLGAIWSQFLKKMEGLQLTPYVEDCCRVLETTNDEVDLLLVGLVRLSSISMTVHHSISNAGGSGSISAPIWMHIRSGIEKVQTLWQSIPESIQKNPLMALSYHGAKISLYEYSLSKSYWPPSPPDSQSQKLDMLYACLLSSKALLDIAVSQPISMYYSMSMLFLAQVRMAYSSLVKLAMLEEPGWDVSHIRQISNFISYIEQVSDGFEKAGNDLDSNQSTPCICSFQKGCATAMQMVKEWYEKRMAVEVDHCVDPEPGFTIPEGMTEDDLRWLDDAYWAEIIGGSYFPQQIGDVNIMGA